MLAEQSLREGRLEETLTQLQEQVRGDPSNPKHRVFLFQLLSVLGQWKRALTQLNVAGDLDAEALAMVQMYREALRCEVLRANIFAGRHTPLVFGDPEPWQALLVEALRLTAGKQYGQAQQLRDQAFEQAPVIPGAVNEEPFTWIADGDMRLGPILEAIISGRYYWIPFHRIHTLRIESPSDLRDLVWMPAYFTWVNGGETVGLIPTRYPGSEENPDAQIRLAHKTEWIEVGTGVYLGQGQRMLATDRTEYPLMDIRRIDMGAPDA